MNGNREKPVGKLRGYGKALDMAYNGSAGGFKHINVFPYINAPGVALGAVKKFDQGKTLALFNSDAALHWYRTYPATDTPTAPTGMADGVPVPPGQYMLIAMGNDTQIISDSALVFAFTIDDDEEFLKP
jgi:hypothetical protein